MKGLIPVENTLTLTDLLKAEIQAELQGMLSEYGNYLHGLEQYTGLPVDGISPHGYWVSKPGRFNKVAIMILNVGVTISDVERLHKSYSRIHTTSRASLNQTRVDNLVLGQVAMKNEKTSAPEFDVINAFKPLTSNQKDDLIGWSKELRTKLVGKKLDAQRANGGDVPAIAATSSVSGSENEVEAEKNEHDSGEDSDPEFSDDFPLEDDEEEREIENLRRSSRVRVAPKRFRDSLDMLKALENVGSS